MTLGLYVHVPFCPHKCFYCDFTAYLYRADRAAAYLGALSRESALARQLTEVSGRRPATLYLGGGTPAALTPEEMAVLLDALGPHLRPEEGAETTCEANPEGLDGARLASLARLGFNRLSLGVQSWDDGNLARLGRRHAAREAREAYGAARRAGFDNINIDLIYGLPGQDLAAWREDLWRTIELEPAHISAYSLQVEAETPYGRWAREGRFRQAGPWRLPDEDAEAEMYQLARDELVGAGYRHYEVSNFALPGRESAHNLLYWQSRDYLGLGPGAHSHVAGRRWWNVKGLAEYRAKVEEGRLPLAGEEPPDAGREMTDMLIMGLRLAEGVSKEAFRRRFGRPIEEAFGQEVRELVGQGHLMDTGDRLCLSPRAYPVANQVLWRFA